jgi:molecular chaperone DnaK (HSP70)
MFPETIMEYVKLEDFKTEIKHLEHRLSHHTTLRTQYSDIINQCRIEEEQSVRYNEYEKMKGIEAKLRYQEALQRLNDETIDRLTKELNEKRKLCTEQLQRIENYARMH